MIEPPAELSASVAAFCSLLRDQHGFAVGHREVRDGLRALEIVGITEARRFRAALRLVCCASQVQTEIFDRAFDAFFLEASRGIAQPAYAPRHTRPGRERPEPEKRVKPGLQRSQTPEETDAVEGESRGTRREVAQNESALRWQALRARYSPAATVGAPLRLDAALARDMHHAAASLVRAVRLGRTRRWRVAERGARFDLRRTMRASMQTGGDPVELRFLGRPPCNPRIVLLIDGSRSVREQTGAVVAFAAALCEQAVRAHVSFFSTALRDVTRELRTAARARTDLEDLGEAWGGGTKIGANLARFIDAEEALLSPGTLVIIFSDGLDAGDTAQLARTMREIDRRTAGIVWLNPHAAEPGFKPVSLGMRTALPFVSLLAAANDPLGFERLAARIGQMPRLRGRRT